MERARAGKGAHFIEVKTYRRRGHAEHDDQHYVPEGEVERWAKENDPVDRYSGALLGNSWVERRDLEDIDAGVRDDVDQATDACLDEPMPGPETALSGVYAAPATAETLWYRLV